MQHLHRTAMLLALIGLLLAGCGGKKESAVSAAPAEAPAQAAAPAAGDPAQGEILYAQACVACHGPDGAGVEGLGKPFTTSEFLLTVDDAELVAFIKQGRDPSDPANTTGVAMPPKGGNPALTDAQLADIVAYVRTLHE